MYIPPHFRQADPDAAVSFMRQYPFAVIASNGPEAPLATHLPFYIKTEGEEIILTAHFAKGNPQWKAVDDANVLVIFSGPHAYISPGLYEKRENVPTWNYVAVHAYGKAELVTGEDEGFSILQELMQQSEPEYLAQWRELNPEYQMRLFKGIVPFRIRVTKIEAKEKLSQNKTAGERSRIIDSLEGSDDGAAQDISKFMAAREAS